MYYRDIAYGCNKRQPGTGCSAIDGQNRMLAVPSQRDGVDVGKLRLGKSVEKGGALCDQYFLRTNAVANSPVLFTQVRWNTLWHEL